MNNTRNTPISFRDLWNTLTANLWLWLAPAIAIAIICAAYAVLHKSLWETSQALVIRNEASGTEKGPGKFNQPEEMKNILEIILEVAKSRDVLEAALREIGAPAGYKNPAAWPTDEDIESIRKNVKLVAPKGAEFGKTEVFYFTTRAEGRERSLAFNKAVLKHLTESIQKLRDAKAQSLIAELTRTVELAKDSLSEATARLAITENLVGGDLAELRSMQEMATSDSALRRSMEETRVALRENDSAEKNAQELLCVIKDAEKDPARFVSTPNRLLESHPALRRLKDGLVDAQIRTATLLGTMSASHPRVIVAKETEEEIARHLREELALARQSIEVELRMIAERRQLLEDQLAKAEARLKNLASIRAEYANQLAEVKNRAALLDRAQNNLAEAEASLAAAQTTSLISSVGLPEVGVRPVGPGRMTIALCGILGGLLTGVGIVFLCVPLPKTHEINNIQPDKRHNGRKAVSFATDPMVETAQNFTLKHALRKLAG